MNISNSAVGKRIKKQSSGKDGWFVRYLTNDEITLNNEE